MPTKKDLMRLFRKDATRLYKLRDIMNNVGAQKQSRKELRSLLGELSEEGKIQRFKGGRYGLLQSSDMVTGTLSIAQRGYGFIRRDQPDPDAPSRPDVFVSQRNLHGAMHGDKVLAHLSRRDSDRREGRITKILKRARTQLVGRFQFERKGGTVIPRDTRIGRIVDIPKLDLRGKLKEGCWVMVRILDYGDQRTPMTGEITDVVGMDEEPGIDILLVIRDYGVKPEFPEAVEREAESLPASISDEEIRKREDLRNLPCFTIDPETAKDFDDALSIEKLENGRFRLGVHIADVAHFVRPGTVIDGEALNRATSIYPVDRVIPMLPERLSNKLCSLRPGEDRLTMSVFMDVDHEGHIHNCRYCNGVIHSRFRLNYTEAQTVLDHSDPWISTRYASIRDQLFALKELSERLIRLRERRGALDLDVGETDVLFDSSGQVKDLRRHPRLASHRIIEQCMILANEAVALKTHRLKFPSLYRVHEPPSQEKLHKIAPVFANFGITLPPKRTVTPRALQRLLERIERLGEAGPILRRVILRSMMRACYSHENLGHYGLGSRYYTHFTSPIRRYPDLIVHRILKQIISGEYREEETAEEWNERLPEIADHCSKLERLSQDIEYESTDIKGLEFMQKFIGFEFDGLISGITGFGMFIELKRYPIEGLIPIASLGKDYFEFDELTLTLKGRRSGSVFRLADPVRVYIEHIDVFRRKMELRLIE